MGKDIAINSALIARSPSSRVIASEAKQSPRLLIAGTESGVGKTTLVTGLIQLWTAQGLRVQPYKVGPDYIDPSFQSLAAGRPSRNLDCWLLPKSRVVELFARHSAAADLSVIEGVMGFYDGYSPTSELGSSAQVAKLLGAPVVLILNGKKMARSAAAVVLGFQKLDPKVNFVGVIFNNVGSERHYDILRRAVEKECRLPSLGYLPTDPKLALPEQHLGLVPVESSGHPEPSSCHPERSEGSSSLRQWLGYLRDMVEKKIDHKRLLKLARGGVGVSPRGKPGDASGLRSPAGRGVSLGSSRRRGHPAKLLDRTKSCQTASLGRAEVRLAIFDRKSTSLPQRDTPTRGASTARIGYAMDEAFHFYYPDNVEMLEELGAEMVRFSPLHDEKIPDVSALYLGGGFPENFAEGLAANESMKRSIRDAIAEGMPTYAECGGLMYLVKELQEKTGKSHAMVGAIPGRVRMTDRLQNFGYQQVKTLRDSILFRKGESSRGHEFHYSVWEPGPNGATAAYETRKRGTDAPKLEGVVSGNLLASYVHIHFGRSPQWARRFVQRAAAYQTVSLRGGRRPTKQSRLLRFARNNKKVFV